jgi:hypothetical protein
MILPKAMWLKGEENYEDWIDDMTMFLGSKGLLKHVKSVLLTQGTLRGPEALEEDAEEKSEEDIEKDDITRMSCSMAIKGSVHTEPAIQLKGITDPKEMWLLLRRRYTSTGWNLKHKYLTEYNALKVEHMDSVSAFVDQFIMLKSKLESTGINLPEEVHTINFISLLDHQHPVWADRQRSAARRVNPKLTELVDDILDESRRPDKSTMALKASNSNTGAKKGKGGKKAKASSEDSGEKCPHCKGHHKANKCWFEHPELRPEG